MLKQIFIFFKPQLLKIWESKPMQKGIIPSFFSIGLVASIYFSCLFFTGCESVNQGFVKVVEIHASEITKDYEKHLKHPENPLFIKYIEVLDASGKPTGVYQKIELPTFEDKEKIIQSRWHSAEELLRVIKEQKESE